MTDLLIRIDDVLYTWCLIYLLAGAGIYFTIRSRFMQLRLFKDCLKCMPYNSNKSLIPPSRNLSL